MLVSALTTFDNPYDPFDEFDNWYMFDMDHNYNSCAYLARIAKTSDALSEQENAKEIDRAINEIVRYNPRNIYKKVQKEIEMPADDDA
jgi:hypothetical protein